MNNTDQQAVINGKRHCANVFRALNMNPGAWQEQVLSGSFKASCSSLNAAKSVVATVASNGSYSVDVVDRNGCHVVGLCGGHIPAHCAEGESVTDTPSLG